MSKKRKKLERAFEKALYNHKYSTIYKALMRHPELYNSKLLRPFNNVKIKEVEGHEGELTPQALKVFAVEETLYDLDKNDIDYKGIYDKVYEMCWKRIKKEIDDTEPIGTLD